MKSIVPVQRVLSLFMEGGKAAGTWGWPQTQFNAEVKVELYLCSPIGLDGLYWTELYLSSMFRLTVKLSSFFKLFLCMFILLTWKIWWAPNNASKWQMGFNSAFKGLWPVEQKQYFHVYWPEHTFCFGYPYLPPGRLSCRTTNQVSPNSAFFTIHSLQLGTIKYGVPIRCSVVNSKSAVVNNARLFSICPTQ